MADGENSGPPTENQGHTVQWLKVGHNESLKMKNDQFQNPTKPTSSAKSLKVRVPNEFLLRGHGMGGLRVAKMYLGYPSSLDCSGCRLLEHWQRGQRVKSRQI